MTGATYERFTSPDGTGIAYRVSGEGSPVVLMHGFMVHSTANFATHQSDDGSGELIPTPGPTVESALLEAGLQVVLMDLRGHGHSDRPHDPHMYSMDIFADDVRALAGHLGLDEAAVVGYSLGALIAERVLSDPWVTKVALCGAGSGQVAGVDPNFDATWEALAQCFSEDRWDEYPQFRWRRDLAKLRDSDFAAMGLIAAVLRPIPADVLEKTSIPVLVLNGGADGGASDESDLSRFIPGAKRVVAGDGNHRGAPSDPLFQAELVRFLVDS